MKEQIKHTHTTDPNPLYIAGKDDERVISSNALIGVVGDDGYIELGEESIAVCGFSSKAITGKKGVALAEIGGILQAGEEGVLLFIYLDDLGRTRIKEGYIGEKGLEPNQFYCLNKEHEIVPYFILPTS
jgi:hypothetical protein